MPAIYDLANRGLLPPGFSLVGFARRDWADEDFAQIVHDSVKAARAHRVPRGGLAAARRGLPLRAGRLRRRRRVRHPAPHHRGARRGPRHRRQPRLLPLHPAEVLRRRDRPAQGARPRRRPATGSWRRVVVEKPFGHDLESARELNTTLDEVFPPESIFRIDHYLGKETVQNILAMRFANNDVRADLELQLRRPRADHHGRGHRHRRPGRLLRRHRRRPRRDPEPPAAADGAGGDGGAARRSRPRTCASRSRRCSRLGQPAASARPAPPPAASTPPGWAGGEKVIGYLEEEDIREDLDDRDVRRDPARGRHPSLGRRARSTCAPASGSGRRVTEVAVVFKRAPHLPFSSDGDRGAHPQRARHPDPARRGR